MARPAQCLAMAVAGLALTASGCGDSAADADPATTRTLDRVAQICDDLTAAVTGRTFPVEGFEPRDPAAAELPAVGAYFETAVQAQRQALASLRALTPPPAIEGDVRRYVTALSDLNDLVAEQVAAANAADPERFAATIDGADARLEAVTTAADELGVESCRG